MGLSAEARNQQASYIAIEQVSSGQATLDDHSETAFADELIILDKSMNAKLLFLNLKHTLRGFSQSLSAALFNAFAQPNTKEMIIPIISLLVAFAGIVSTSVIQIVGLRTQNELKQYEVTFIAKQKAYADLMRSTHKVFNAGFEARSSGEIKSAINDLETSVYAVQPFLSRKESSILWEEAQKLIGLSISGYESSRRGINLSG
jgi:ABC-type multidrug transport system fused ATPase/permease subunit